MRREFSAARASEKKPDPKMYRETVIPGVYTLKLKAPVSAQFELTSGCNYRCQFCYNVWKEGCTAGKPNGDLSKEDKFRVIDKFTEYEIYDVIISGGEPFLVPYLPELVQRGTRGGQDIFLISNGSLITRENMAALKGSGLTGIQISLHDYQKKLSDEITQRKGSFEKTLEGIKVTTAILGAENLNVNMVAFKKNHKDIYGTGKFLHELGVLSFTVGTLSMTGSASAIEPIDGVLFKDILKQLEMVEKDFGMNVAFTGGFPLCLFKNVGKKELRLVANVCDAGLNQLVVASNGDLRPCVCYGEVLGNILRDDLTKIWKNNEFLRRVQKLEHVPGACRKCKFVSRCKGGCRASALAKYGEFDALDPLVGVEGVKPFSV